MSNGNPTLRWIFFGLAFIVLIIAISSGIKSCSKDKDNPKEKEGKSKTESVEYEWVIVNTKTVYFSGEYDKITYLYSGENLSFKDASEPYCIKNSADEEVCAEKGEDAGLKMPNSHNNMQLRFKSQNGKSGQITIVFWRHVRKKK